MKKIVLIIFVILGGFTSSLYSNESDLIQRISEGKKNAKIVIITFESMTCIHCANFHKDVYPQLKKDFIDTGLVRIEFRHFPLNMAALNASKISQCKNDGKSDLMHILFSNQKKWAEGKDISEVNVNLMKILKNEEINLDFKACTTNKNIEDFVLNDRIEGIKKFNVNATPTIIINDQKFEKSLNYKNLKK